MITLNIVDYKDLKIFDSEEEQKFFKEVMQCYYSQNYRGAIVLLYSLVIYNLYQKLHTMSLDGNKSAITELSEIKKMLENHEEKYSQVENRLLEYFKNNHSLYFNNFNEDIEYLKQMRHKCAHLQINNENLYVPKDYQVKMVINSMYENIFSVKAPFILDLFSFVKDEIEKISTDTLLKHSWEKDKESFKEMYNRKYYSRMTDISFEKTIKSFIKLSFISEEDEPVKNFLGIYIFLYTTINAMLNKGLINIFVNPKVIEKISNISFDIVKKYEGKLDKLFELCIDFPIFKNAIKKHNQPLYQKMNEFVFNDSSNYVKYCKYVDIKIGEDYYQLYKQKHSKIRINTMLYLYGFVSQEESFDINEFIKMMVLKVPTVQGYSMAGEFCSLFRKVFNELDDETVIFVIEQYDKNDQFYSRQYHKTDSRLIKELNEQKNKLDLSKYINFMN